MNKTRTMTVNLNTKVWFGGYKGKTIEQLSRINPEYLNWAIKEGIISLTSQSVLELSAQGKFVNGRIIQGETNDN